MALEKIVTRVSYKMPWAITNNMSLEPMILYNKSVVKNSKHVHSDGTVGLSKHSAPTVIMLLLLSYF